MGQDIGFEFNTFVDVFEIDVPIMDFCCIHKKNVTYSLSKVEWLMSKVEWLTQVHYISRLNY